jgi:hypothetical protein
MLGRKYLGIYTKKAIFLFDVLNSEIIETGSIDGGCGGLRRQSPGGGGGCKITILNKKLISCTQQILS